MRSIREVWPPILRSLELHACLHHLGDSSNPPSSLPPELNASRCNRALGSITSSGMSSCSSSVLSKSRSRFLRVLGLCPPLMGHVRTRVLSIFFFTSKPPEELLATVVVLPSYTCWCLAACVGVESSPPGLCSWYPKLWIGASPVRGWSTTFCRLQASVSVATLVVKLPEEVVVAVEVSMAPPPPRGGCGSAAPGDVLLEVLPHSRAAALLLALLAHQVVGVESGPGDWRLNTSAMEEGCPSRGPRL